ncbi:MAG: glutamate-ammonia-ligase adenylyltransferase, partial [Paracoccaceae bacterium]
MTTSFASRLSRAPLAADPARGEEAWAALSAAAPVAPELRDLIVGAAGSAPYIAGLIRNQADWLVHALTLDPDAALADALQPARDAAIAPAADRSRLLRTAKKRTALYAALADLGGVWSLEQTTGALSD